MDAKAFRIIGCGAGFAGDRIDPAVQIAASGKAHAIALECLAERTLVPGLRARKADPNAGHDPRLERRLKPLLPVARTNRCRIISNLGAANPAAAARKIAKLASANRLLRYARGRGPGRRRHGPARQDRLGPPDQGHFARRARLPRRRCHRAGDRAKARM